MANIIAKTLSINLNILTFIVETHVKIAKAIYKRSILRKRPRLIDFVEEVYAISLKSIIQ